MSHIIEWTNLLEEVTASLRTTVARVPVYLAGGAIRDTFCGVEPRDYDVFLTAPHYMTTMGDEELVDEWASRLPDTWRFESVSTPGQPGAYEGSRIHRVINFTRPMEMWDNRRKRVQLVHLNGHPEGHIASFDHGINTGRMSTRMGLSLSPELLTLMKTRHITLNRFAMITDETYQRLVGIAERLGATIDEQPAPFRIEDVLSQNVPATGLRL